ncbi:hypothetical protein L7F22_066105 [Adiantum nelumboides]|nr:hypothetical protein [Adiantum nelumboides]
MADNNEEGRIDVDSFDFANEGASEETAMLVNYLITRLQQAMANPALQCEVQQQLQAYGFIPPHQEERIPEKSLGETSKRGTSKIQRSGGRNDATPPRAPPTEEAPSPEVTMEESTTGKKKEPTKGKQKCPAYKLQSDIKPATHLKKVLEERILNSKVDFTLGEVLGSANREFHEEIIDIIKRKSQTLGEAIRP